MIANAAWCLLGAVLYLMVGVVTARAWYRREVKRIQQLDGWQWHMMPSNTVVGGRVLGWPAVGLGDALSAMCDAFDGLVFTVGKIVKGKLD